MDPVVITALDQEGRGVARVEGKTVFVDGALIGECVSIEIIQRKRNHDLARVTEIHRASPARATPPCPYFGICGGCSLQHLDPTAQVAVKQRVLEDALWHIGRVQADQLLAPIHGTTWGYRHRARLSVRDVAKKGGILVGFHERRSSYVADMTSCLVLPPRISALLTELRALIARLSIRNQLPQIELSIGEDSTGPVDALVLRILAPLEMADRRELEAFAAMHDVQLYLQPAGPASVQPLQPPGRTLSYGLPEFGLTLEFEPTDFTQVNAGLNRVLVRRAVGLLEPNPGETVADFFCGLGNFTLPIGRRGATVIGVDGSRALIARALANAERNRLAGNVRFTVANLFEATRGSIAAMGRPRQGAARPTSRRCDRTRQGAAGGASVSPRLCLVQPRHARP